MNFAWRLRRTAHSATVTLCFVLLCAPIFVRITGANPVHAQERRNAPKIAKNEPAKNKPTTRKKSKAEGGARAPRPSTAESVAKRRWMPAVLSREQFDVMARTYNPDLLHPLSHVLFVIDRAQENKIYYVNMRHYSLHETFVNSLYLSLERGRTFWENNHLKDNRRFICGRIVYQSAVKRFAFEFWEGDTISSAQLALTSQVINRSFFQPVAFKPNSPMQDEKARNAPGVARLGTAELAAGEIKYQPLNVARVTGRLRVVRRSEDLEATTPAPDEILVLDETPVSLPPVAGLIQTRMATPLSHLNLLARSWAIPNAFVRRPLDAFVALDGKLVTYETRRDGFTLEPANDAALDLYNRARAARRRTMTPTADLSVRDIKPLGEQRASHFAICGSKSANLGEVMNARIPGVVVPDGWTIPFFHYDQFMRDNKFYPFVRTMLQDERFRRDAAHRRERLAQIRQLIRSGALNADLRRTLADRFTLEQRARGVFVRSSSNTEDLPNFNGAGLYDTVPNVRGEDELMDAVKTVWASLWNFEAFETRERAGVDHIRAMMAVLVQEGVNADAAGVMITTDPFDETNRAATYISAKRGLGIRVVEGKSIAEQILYDPRTSKIELLTRSAEDSLLEFDDRGGLREVPIKGTRVVLTDDVVRRLAFVAQIIKRHFGGAEQDIEWVLMRGQIYIVQSRPYITNSAQTETIPAPRAGR